MSTCVSEKNKFCVAITWQAMAVQTCSVVVFHRIVGLFAEVPLYIFNYYYYYFSSRFQLLLPKSWKSVHRPVYIHLAGTGDHVRVYHTCKWLVRWHVATIADIHVYTMCLVSSYVLIAHCCVSAFRGFPEGAILLQYRC